MTRCLFSHRWKTRLFLVLLLILLLALAAGEGRAAPASLPAFSFCEQTSLTVSFGLLNLQRAQVSGTLCSDGPLAGRTVQVLVSGASYGPAYWDFPYDPQTYSYVRALTAAGYATFDLARLGIAPSAQPAALDVTIDDEASVLHQVIQALHSGQIGGTAFSKVMVVGHSLGSIIAIDEAASYADVDGLIITGFLHDVGLNQIFSLLALYPARQDPNFAGANPPVGYLTTEPNTRSVYYHLSDADPAVLREDEATKATITTGELATAVPAEGIPPSLLIHVPVLAAVGQYDNVFCGMVDCSQALHLESAFYGPAACLETFILPDAGHSLNLHLNAPQWFQAAINWSNRRLGPSVNRPPTAPC